MSMDCHRCSWIFMDVHGCSYMSIDFHWFQMPVTAIWLTLALLLIDKSFDKHPKCPFSTSHYTCYAYATIVTSTVTDSWRIHNYNKVLFGLNKMILMLLRSSEKSVSKLFYHLKGVRRDFFFWYGAAAVESELSAKTSLLTQ